MVRTEKELEDLEKNLANEAKELEVEKQKFKQDQKKFSAYIENKIKTLKSMEKKSTTTDPRRGKITKVTEPVSVFKAKKVVVPTKK